MGKKTLINPKPLVTSTLSFLVLYLSLHIQNIKLTLLVHVIRIFICCWLPSKFLEVQQDLLSSAKTKNYKHQTSRHWTDPSGKIPRAKASGQNTNSLVFLQEEGLSPASYLRNQTLPATPACSCSTSTRSKHRAAILQTSDKSGTKEISTGQKSPRMGIEPAGNKTLDFKPQLW